MNKTILGFLAVLLVVIGGIFIFHPTKNSDQTVLPSVTPSNGTIATPTSTVAQANIVVTSPSIDGTVTNPITVTGKARVFENTFNFILRDATGKNIYESNAMANAPDAGQFGNFSIKIPVPVGASQNLTIEVFDYSAKDGSVVDLVKVPVKLSTTQTMTVKSFFGFKGVSEQDCSATRSVNRTVIRTQETAFMALTELLKGLSVSELQAGFYITSIPANVRINSLNIRNAIAYADFDETLQSEVAGSCRVTAIRSQITETLKQFSTIKDVVISINGRINDILQP